MCFSGVFCADNGMLGGKKGKNRGWIQQGRKGKTSTTNNFKFADLQSSICPNIHFSPLFIFNVSARFLKEIIIFWVYFVFCSIHFFTPWLLQELNGLQRRTWEWGSSFCPFSRVGFALWPLGFDVVPWGVGLKEGKFYINVNKGKHAYLWCKL